MPDWKLIHSGRFTIRVLGGVSTHYVGGPGVSIHDMADGTKIVSVDDGSVFRESKGVHVVVGETGGGIHFGFGFDDVIEICSIKEVVIWNKNMLEGEE